jgi:hypothetical protein
MKLLTSDNLLRAGIAALLVGGLLWLASCTEWVEVDVPKPPSPEAAKNDLLALEDLARRLGVTVERPTDLPQMPPAGSTVYFAAWHAGIVPGRGERLRAWVADGGHLVLQATDLDEAELVSWLPVRTLKPPAPAPKHAASGADAPDDEEDDDEDEEADARSAPAAQASRPATGGKPDVDRLLKQVREGPPCRSVAEPDAVTPAFPPARRFMSCAHPPWPRVQPKVPATWQLDAENGIELLRVPHGRGSVTVLAGWDLRGNRALARGDNGLIAAAALQLHRGQLLWIVEEESRPSLMRWLWQAGAAAVLLSGLALLLAWWRAAPRFGPMTVPTPPGRRSMVEQVTGTARFLWRHGPLALHAAQVRALDETARLHVMRYDELERSARASAIAKLTGLDAAALGLALDRGIPRRRIDLPPVLDLLETARRRLVQGTAGRATPPLHTDS